MYRDHKISLVIPAYNEERLIGPTLDNVPAYFDKIFVIDDCSTDNMAQVVRERASKDARIELIQHRINSGVGQGIITGYLRSSQDGYDIAVVCGGDHQMPLHESPNLIDPIIDEGVHYCKGNRFMNNGNAFSIMPATRFWGNTLLSLMTKVASGHYDVFDVVDGFVAISKEGIDRVDWSKAWKGYGYPMDFIIRIASAGMNLKDVARTAIYLPGERQSQIKGVNYMLKVTPMIWRAFIDRLIYQHVFADFHPLVLLYGFGFLSLGIGSLGATLLVFDKLLLDGTWVSGPKSIFVAMALMSGIFSCIMAMGMDFQNFQFKKILHKLNQKK